VLLLDEPTVGLSAAEVVRVVGMISDLPKDMTVLMIEHDTDVAFDIADRRRPASGTPDRGGNWARPSPP